MIIKKRWSLAAKPAGERGNQCLFLNTAYAWQQEYIVDTQPGLSTERYTRIVIINLITTIFCRNVFKVAKGRWDWKSIWRKKPCGCDQQYEYGLEFSFI